MTSVTAVTTMIEEWTRTECNEHSFRWMALNCSMKIVHEDEKEIIAQREPVIMHYDKEAHLSYRELMFPTLL